jgi:hypothetical protein
MALRMRDLMSNAPALEGPLATLSFLLAQNGEALGTMWGEQRAREKLAHQAGFTNVDVMGVEGDLLNAYHVATKR